MTVFAILFAMQISSSREGGTEKDKRLHFFRKKIKEVGHFFFLEKEEVGH